MTVAGAPLRVAVMGVAGAGKTTIARALVAAIDVAYIDADDLHPASNVRKMSAGVPLDDDDRWPWLELVGAAVVRSPGGAVVAHDGAGRNQCGGRRPIGSAGAGVELNGAGV